MFALLSGDFPREVFGMAQRIYGTDAARVRSTYSARQEVRGQRDADVQMSRVGSPRRQTAVPVDLETFLVRKEQ